MMSLSCVSGFWWVLSYQCWRAYESNFERPFDDAVDARLTLLILETSIPIHFRAVLDECFIPKIILPIGIYSEALKHPIFNFFLILVIKFNKF